MSQFEYVTVLTSFVVAFGVSQLLAGWGRVYLLRKQMAPYPLQLAASGLLLVALLQSIWGYWAFRDVAWTFGAFLIALAPLLPLVGAAYLVLPQPASAPIDLRTHYFAVAPAIFGLLASWILLGTLTELALVDARLHLGQASRLGGIAVLAALAVSANPAVHWAGLLALAGLQGLFVLVVTPALD